MVGLFLLARSANKVDSQDRWIGNKTIGGWVKTLSCLEQSREWTSTGGSKRQTQLTAEESADEIDMARADSGTGRLCPLLVFCYVDVKP